MNEEQCTSLELSKWLHENGCEIETDYCHVNENDSCDPVYAIHKTKYIPGTADVYGYPVYSYYDILVTHAKEFFGEEKIVLEEKALDFGGYEKTTTFSCIHYPFMILRFLQDKEYSKAEDYIKANCVFNKP